MINEDDICGKSRTKENIYNINYIFFHKMLEAINEFVSNNSMLVLLGLVAVVLLVGFVMFRRSGQQGHNSGNGGNGMGAPVPTPSHDLEGLDNTNMVCDLANGVCMPAHTQHQDESQHPLMQDQ